MRSDYTKAMELNSSFQERIIIAGVAYQHLGEHGQAIADFSRTIKLNLMMQKHIPQGGSATMHRAIMLQQLQIIERPYR